MSLDCRIGLHPWEPWSAPALRTGRERDTANGLPFTEWRAVEVLVQERTCRGCGMARVRKVQVER